MNRKQLVSFGLFLLMSLLTGVLTTPVAAQGVSFSEATAANLPWDAAPSPDGATIYYTAIGKDGAPAVFSVPAAGGDPVVLVAGEPMAMPFGIDVSSDGKTVYVSDPWMAGAAGNAIFALPSDGSAGAKVVNGTQGTEPQGVTLVGDQIYFSGINLANGEPAIYKIPAAGADAPTLVAHGAPLIAPAGLAVAKDGTVYVLDRLASGNGQGSVLRIQNGKVDSIAADVHIGGQMPGIALTLDESTLLASSLDKSAGTAQVLAINLGTMESGIINDVIKVNTAAGGLHRAHNANIFAWSDISRSGKVYRVEPGS